MNSKLQKFKFSDKLLSSVKILYPNALLLKIHWKLPLKKVYISDRTKFVRNVDISKENVSIKKIIHQWFSYCGYIHTEAQGTYNINCDKTLREVGQLSSNTRD